MSRLAIFKELWSFLKIRKKWWLAPMIIVLFLLGALYFLLSLHVVRRFFIRYFNTAGDFRYLK
jgi:hypothetical protein